MTATGVVIAVALTGAWLAVGKRKSTVMPYLTATVDRGTVIQSVSTTGTLTAVTTVKVGSQVSGIIASLFADFNDVVKASQVLAVLDPTPFEATVNQAKAQLERAKVASFDADTKLKRQKALFEASLASQDQLDSAQAAYDQATAQVTELQASLERAQTNLRYSVIRAPIDGVVVSRDYDVGQTVAASFQAPTLFTIAEDLTRMQLTCQVDEADIGEVVVGQHVRFSVDAFPEREFTGTVSQIRLSPQITNNVVTYPVIVEVSNQDLKLLPGMTADVRIQVARSDGVLRVPTAALRFRPELLGLNGEASGSPGRPGGSGPPGRDRTSGERGEVGTPKGKTQLARVYVPTDKAGQSLALLEFVPGLTDGQYVEVRSGEVSEGERIVVGVVTAQGQDMGGLAGMTRGGRH